MLPAGTMSTHCSSIPTETADPAKQVCRYGTGDNCVVGRVTFLSLRPTTDRPQDCMVKETLDSLRCVGMHASFDRMRSRISSYDSTCEDDYGQHCRLSSDSARNERIKHEYVSCTGEGRKRDEFILSCFLFICPPIRKFDRRYP